MKCIYKGERRELRQRKIDHVFITYHSEQGANTYMETGFDTILVNKKAKES